jgi:hypothetical protein
MEILTSLCSSLNLLNNSICVIGNICFRCSSYFFHAIVHHNTSHPFVTTTSEAEVQFFFFFFFLGKEGDDDNKFTSPLTTNVSMQSRQQETMTQCTSTGEMGRNMR